MSKLITRQIDPRIEIINKILVFMTPLLLLSLINFGGVGCIEVLLFVGCMVLGIYELYIYKTNEEFISLVEADKNHLAYKLIVKYYKLGFLIVIFLLPQSLIDAFFNNFYYYDYIYIIIGTLISYYLLMEIIISHEKFTKLIVKYILLFITMYFVNIITYYGYRIYFSYLLLPIIYFQIFYLLFNFNILYLHKDQVKKPNYLNYDLIISLVVIIIYEIIASSIFNSPLLTIPSIISYFIFLIVILGLNDSLKKYYKVKKTRYSKIVKYYFVGSIFVLPLMFTILGPISYVGILIRDSIMDSDFITWNLIFKQIIYFIIIELINIVILILYKFKKYIFKYDFISTANKIYDRWM